MATVVNPIILEVLRNAIQTVAEEAGVTLIRTALSPNIKDRRDCSTAIYTAEGELVAQAEHIPLHLGLMPSIVKAVLKEFPLTNCERGDAIIVNDPYTSGSHLPDICVMTPYFHGGQPVAIAANLAHHVDVGGAVPGSMGTGTTEIFGEGIRIPPLRIRRRGKLNNSLLRLISHNVRTSREFNADLQAQLNANDVGIKRLQELAGRYGLPYLQRYMREIIAYAEKRTRAALSAIPENIAYTFEDYLEGDGLTDDLLKITVRIIRCGDKLTVDFTGTQPQVRGPVNATYGVTCSCVYFAVKAALDPDIPSSEGLVRPIRIIAPPGTLVNASFPAAVAHANINTAQRIADVILGALAQAIPKRVTAAGTGSMSNFTIGGFNSGTGKYFSYVETYGGGQGAKYDMDGLDGVHVNMTNTRNTPVEVIETSYPIIVERYNLVEDSGGPGKFRGGAGICREILLTGNNNTVSVSTERNKLPPWGLEGGLPGGRAVVEIKPEGIVEDKPKLTCNLPSGSRVILKTAGGGGYGDPLERDPELVRLDVLNGLVSSGIAREVYGVVFEGDNLNINFDETKSLRKTLSKRSAGC